MQYIETSKIISQSSHFQVDKPTLLAIMPFDILGICPIPNRQTAHI